MGNKSIFMLIPEVLFPNQVTGKSPLLHCLLKTTAFLSFIPIFQKNVLHLHPVPFSCFLCIDISKPKCFTMLPTPHFGTDKI